MGLAVERSLVYLSFSNDNSLNNSLDSKKEKSLRESNEERERKLS